MKRRAGLAAALALLALGGAARAEYGDVVINNRSDAEGMRPVVFPHWFHRVRFRCSFCHGDLEIRMRAGSNDIAMKDLIDGRFCGACHNGKVAWSIERCDLCHSGRPGAKTGVYGAHRSTGPGVW